MIFNRLLSLSNCLCKQFQSHKTSKINVKKTNNDWIYSGLIIWMTRNGHMLIFFVLYKMTRILPPIHWLGSLPFTKTHKLIYQYFR